MRGSNDPLRILIVGSGLSGTFVATHLTRHPDVRSSARDVRIFLVERANEFGPGVAYSTSIPSHLLNVTAGKMSAFEEDPDHFLRFLEEKHRPAASHEYVPRKIYGGYLKSILAEAEKNGKITRLQDECTGLKLDRLPAIRATFRNREALEVDQVVLAIGNPPPALPHLLEGDNEIFKDLAHCICDPWQLTDRLPELVEKSVLLIGSGLTMIDQALSLKIGGHKNVIHAISRHGLLPAPHEGHSPLPSTPWAKPWPATTNSWLRRVRSEAENCANSGQDWRAAMDLLRPLIPEIWSVLPVEERRRFFRHARAYWEIHRHRVSPEILAEFASWRASGEVELHAGRLLSLRRKGDGLLEARIQRRGSLDTLSLDIQTIVNCTGPDYRYAASQQPLLADLTQSGTVRAHPLGIGLDTDSDGALLDASGKSSRWLHTLGSVRIGERWETTAAPEIRAQAAKLAERLVRL